MSFPPQRSYYEFPLGGVNSGGGAPFHIDVRYQNLKPVGAGSYGVVCAADDTMTGRKVAIKRIGDTFHDLVDAKRIVREIKLLRHFDGHENIIGILDMFFMPPNTQDFHDVYIVTDLMESDLDRIVSSRQPLTDAHYQYFVYQLLRGLKYLHSANVLHRDLKPSNLLVNANCDLAICDFGLARGVDVQQIDPLTEYVVTRYYRAPELLCAVEDYGPAIDVWAVGCIFAELVMRRPLFQGNNPTDQLQVIVRALGSPCPADQRFITRSAPRNTIRLLGHCPEVPLERLLEEGARSKGSSSTAAAAAQAVAALDPLAVDLMKRMLTFCPERRITVEEALNHPYLSKLHQQSEEPHASSPFNFDFERESASSGEDIPRHELQRLMWEDMMAMHHQKQQQQQQQQFQQKTGGERKSRK